MITAEEVLHLFREHQALLEGHFILSSGLHSGTYLQCALVLQFPELAARLGAALAEKINMREVTAVATPALGGVLVSHEVARALHVRAIFTERQNGLMTLRRGFSVSSADRIVVVEDVITTGQSTLETVEVMTRRGAHVVAIGSIIDRSGGRSMFPVPHCSLATVALETFPKENCPLCRQGVPAVKLGSRI